MYFNTVPAKLLPCYIGKKQCIIVDLRSEKEFQAGHVCGAINIPYEKLSEHCDIFDQYQEVVLYCARGNASIQAARDYQNHKANIINIYGGIRAYRGELVC